MLMCEKTILVEKILFTLIELLHIVMQNGIVVQYFSTQFRFIIDFHDSSSSLDILLIDFNS